jgi:hypothetical protein
VLPKAPSIRAFMLFGSLLGVWVLGVLLAPRQATLGFYSTSAQVIPVLLLVILLEARLFDMHVLLGEWRAHQYLGLWAAFYAMLVLIAMIAAEFVALHPLATGKAADGHADTVYGGLAVGFGAVVVIGLVRSPTARAGNR